MRTLRPLVALSIAAWASACDGKMTQPAVDGAAASPPAVTAASSASAASPGADAGATAAAATRPPEAIAAQHVLVAWKGAERAPKGVARTKADARKRAEEVASKAKAGADFSTLVAEYSDDPAAKERQGSLGKFTREKMAKAFSDAAFQLQVDETSAPVETPFGFHVIKRNQ
jgi:parvulin-like peptidyl-prolyl isomerase